MFVLEYSYENTVAIRSNRAKGVTVFEGTPIRYNIPPLQEAADLRKVYFIPSKVYTGEGGIKQLYHV